MSVTFKKTEAEVALQQILQRDGSVYSVQWLDFPESCAARLSVEQLLQRYLRFIREWTRGIIRPAQSDEGIEFRVFASPVALLAFAAPQLSATDEEEEACLLISGGILLQPGECGSGMFSFRCGKVEQRVRVIVELSDFCPLLLGSRTPSRTRKLLYRLTQAFIHKVVTVRFLSRLYWELTGVKIRPVVKKVQVREGLET